jgi:hypothetical protein
LPRIARISAVPRPWWIGVTGQLTAEETSALFVPGQGSSLECAGEPTAETLDHLSHALLHAALHQGQRARADSLLTAHLGSPEGRRTEERFEVTPAAARQRRLFGSALQGLVPHLSEMIVHTFAYQGVLRELAGVRPAAAHWQAIRGKAERVLGSQPQPVS